MSLLGSDFNVEQPSDADLAKYGARWMRDIKSRLKSFVGVMFDGSTGLLKSNSVITSMLAEQPTSAGTWNEVTVNSKGLVTAGVSRVADTSKQKTYYAIYQGGDPAGGAFAYWYDHATGAWRTDNGLSEPQNNATLGYVYPFSFAVPSGVSRLTVSIFGASEGGSYATPVENSEGGDGGNFLKVLMEVTPLTNVAVYVGARGLGATGGGGAGYRKSGTTRVGTDTYGAWVLGAADGYSSTGDVYAPSGGIYSIGRAVGAAGAVGYVDGNNHYSGAGGVGAQETVGGPFSSLGGYGDGPAPTSPGVKVNGGANNTRGGGHDGMPGTVVIEYIA